MKLNAIKMEKGNRMIRFGFGQHESLWFVRLDLWWYGVRLSQEV